jgi:N-carbamoylputrescine amidase
MNNTIRVAAVQQAYRNDKQVNLRHNFEGIRAAAGAGAQLVVLPELHTTPYFCTTQDVANFELAEPVPGPSTEALARCAAELKVVLVSSVFERRAAGVYHNTAVVFDADGSLAGRYRKMHIPDDPGYNEKFYFAPGDLGFQPIKTSLGNLGVLVCWDQWFPEAARLMATAGADMLIYPTAIGWDTRDGEAEQQRQLDAWVTVQRGHAIANTLPLIACNRVGTESVNAKFWGNSFICGPQGEFLARAETEETLLTAEIDMHASERLRRSWPYLRDRRIDAYQDLTRRFRD